MPANKNALIRYKALDQCLRNKYKDYTIDDLVEACSKALYEQESREDGVSKRTVQGDIQVMRSGKLGYYAPIDVYEGKYYRYSDPDYSISENPLTEEDYMLLKSALIIIENSEEKREVQDVCNVLSKLKDRFKSILSIN